MTEHFEIAELDDATRAYLAEAVRRRGKGMPGVFLTAAEANVWAVSLPYLGLAGGLLVALATWGMTTGSADNAVASTLFRTAGYGLGLWMFFAGVRLLWERATGKALGWFVYVDPTAVWRGTGRGVDYSDLDTLVTADNRHNYNDANTYTSSTVSIDRAAGELTVNTVARMKGVLLQDFLKEVKSMNDGTPAERGRVAKEQALAGDPDKGNPAIDDDDVYKGDIPEPKRAKPRSNLLSLLGLVGGGAAVAAASYFVGLGDRDDGAYAAVASLGPPFLRSYLADPANTRHRDEAQAKLAAQIDGRVATLRNHARPLVKEGLANLLAAVGKGPHAVMTLSVAAPDKGAAEALRVFSPAHLATLGREAMGPVAARLNSEIGDGFVGVGAVEGAAAHLTFTPVEAAAKEGTASILWRVVLVDDTEKADPTTLFRAELRTTARGAGFEDVAALRGAYLDLAKVFGELMDAAKVGP